MQNTNNFGLLKPERLIDNISIDVINENMDIIDETLKDHDDAISNKANVNDIPTAETISGTLPLSKGGTGANSAAEAIKALGIGYSTCATAGGTAAKVAALTNYSLVVGGIIVVKFTNANTIINPTLNVNNTGAKAIYCGGVASVPGQIISGMMALFQYDGTYWQLLNPAFPSGITPIANGGTGAITASEALSALGGAPLASPAFTGIPTAPAGTDYATLRLRNIQASTTDLTTGTSVLANGAIYIVYE